MSSVIVIRTGEDSFIVGETGIIINFYTPNPEKSSVGIMEIQEGAYVNGNWKKGRILNGDQNQQGRYLRIEMNSFEIQKLALYNNYN